MDKKHYAWVDYAKCLSMLLVISYHSPGLSDGLARNLILLLGMPVFFMISGFLFSAEKFPTLRSFLKRRCAQLLVPYTCFYLFFYILWLLLGRSMGDAAEQAIPWWDPLLDFLCGNPTVVIAPYWFVCCLFVIQTIYYLLLRYVPRRWITPIVLLAPLLHAVPVVDMLPWKLSLAFLYLPLYALPNLHKDLLSGLASARAMVVLPTLVAGLAGAHFVRFGSDGILQNYLLVVSPLALLPAYMALVQFLTRAKTDAAARFVGGNTLILLAFQNYVIGAGKLLVPGYEAWGLGANLLFSAGTLLLCCVPIYLISSYAPFVVGRGPLFGRKLRRMGAK